MRVENVSAISIPAKEELIQRLAMYAEDITTSDKSDEQWFKEYLLDVVDRLSYGKQPIDDNEMAVLIKFYQHGKWQRPSLVDYKEVDLSKLSREQMEQDGFYIVLFQNKWYRIRTSTKIRGVRVFWAVVGILMGIGLLINFFGENA
ncbi:hypothetical protein GCM10011571_33520 [Marinithermofilum abyssi]|uniref:Uncharacterized protein n=1 Tax=Marinithermofilum abyssi TaxID=1571185 RepID=A0A8J2VJE5_9BACL|nr:hypothetical protein [Marinithermofilum abyssi]GGE28701.1 hypothetical protein GCM10011571_33520 [Marinithermofilum abyssi]